MECIELFVLIKLVVFAPEWLLGSEGGGERTFTDVLSVLVLMGKKF